MNEKTYSTRKRINITQNSRGLNIETTCEMIDATNEEAVKESKELFELASSSVTPVIK